MKSLVAFLQFARELAKPQINNNTLIVGTNIVVNVLSCQLAINSLNHELAL